MGWSLHVFATAEEMAGVGRTLGELPVPLMIDQLGGADLDSTRHDRHWRVVRDLVRDGAWVKVSGMFRLTDPPTVTGP